MFARLFGMLQQAKNPNDVLAKLSEIEKSLAKKEAEIERKNEEEMEKVMTNLEAGKRGVAQQCLRRVKYYDGHLKLLENHHSLILHQSIVLQNALLNSEILEVVRDGAYGAKSLLYSGDVGKITKEISESTTNLLQFQDGPFGAAAKISNEQLDRELDEFEVDVLQKRLGPVPTHKPQPAI